MTRVLVTGGCGYIGSHMVRTLLAAGHAVTVLDDLSGGHASTLPSQATFVKASLFDRVAVDQALTDVDAVYHFAGSIQVGESTRNPTKYYENNVVGSLALVRAMTERGVRKMIFSSTAAVYASSDTLIAEEAALAPESPYGDSKLAFERALPHFARAHGLEFVVLRYFNAAGAGFGLREDHEPETHLIPLAIRAARSQNEPLTVFGTDYNTEDGSCVRDYVHVRDLCDAHLVAHRRLGTLPHRVYNLGGGQGTSVYEVLRAVEGAIGSPVPTVMGARRQGDVARLVADIARAQRDLEFTPKRSSIVEIVRDAASA